MKKNIWLKKPFNLNKINAGKPLGDYDGDKVLNIFDCKPYNRKKQGDEINLYTTRSGY